LQQCQQTLADTLAAQTQLGDDLAAARASVDQQASTLTALEHDLVAARAAASSAGIETDAALVTLRLEAEQKQQTLQQQIQQLHAQLGDVHAQLEHAAGASAATDALRAERDTLAARVVLLEAGLAEAQAVASGAPSAADAALATVRSLLQGVDPLRWGLGAAIDYLSPFEGNDQGLASHVRNLRLLQATLARLATESGKVAAAG
jgi:glutathione S-transferase